MPRTNPPHEIEIRVPSWAIHMTNTPGVYAGDSELDELVKVYSFLGWCRRNGATVTETHDERTREIIYLIKAPKHVDSRATQWEEMVGAAVLANATQTRRLESHPVSPTSRSNQMPGIRQGS